MAKVNIEYDTVDKTLVVKKDGVALDDVQSVSFYDNYDDGYSFNVHCVTKDDEHDMRMGYYISASQIDEKLEAKAAEFARTYV